MAAVAQKYKGRAQFLFVYCRESHPEGAAFRPGSVPIRRAETLREQTETARRFASSAKPRRRVLVDEFGEQSLLQRFGNAENPVIVLDGQGRIALKLLWSDASLVDAFLSELLDRDGRADPALAVRASFRHESLLVRMFLARRFWKEERELRVAVPLLADIARGLVHGGPESNPDLVRAIAPHARRKAAEALGEIGPPAKAAIAALCDAVADPDIEVREAAAAALRRINPQAAAVQTQAAASSSFPARRSTAP